VDLVLAADNAIVVGMVAATVAAHQRHRVIVIGITMAALMRIGFGLITIQLLQLVGLLFVGGVLLLWVAWKLWQNLRSGNNEGNAGEIGNQTSIRRAAFQIALADLSMSLDNVLAVAGVARHFPMILIFGIALSVVLMAIGATMVARVLERYQWIAYIGLGVILYVALSMIWAGAIDIKHYLLLT